MSFSATMAFNPTFTSESLFSSSSGPNSVSNDLIQYLLQIEPLISLRSEPERESEQGQEESDESEEERQRLFLNNVLVEMTGQELNLSLHHDGSRVFEKFISSCQAYQQKSLLVTVCQALEPGLERLAVDRFGSHVLQALLKAVRPFIEREVVSQEQASESALADWIEQACRVCLVGSSNAASHMLTNEYGSHVLRSLLVTLVGRDLYCQVEAESHAMSSSTLSSGSRNKQSLRTKSSFPVEDKWVYKIPTERFAKLFACYTDALSTMDGDTLKGWAFHQSASPVLQFLLIYYSVQESKQESAHEGLPRFLDTLSTTLAMDTAFFWRACRHKIASHFLQSLLRAMGRRSPTLYHSFYTRVIRAKTSESSQSQSQSQDASGGTGLGALLLDPTGNYVLQSLVEYAPSPEFFDMLLGHLQELKMHGTVGQNARGKKGGKSKRPRKAPEPEAPARQQASFAFSDLIVLNRFGLFLKMTQASIRLKVSLDVQSAMVKLCLSLLKESSSSDKLLPCLLSLNKQVPAATTGPHFEYMGCLTTTLLVTHYDPQSVKPILDSVLKCCTHGYLLSMAMNAYASFTLEAILCYSNAKIWSILASRLLFSRGGDVGTGGDVEPKENKDAASQLSSTTEDVFWRLATDKHGSHILQTIYEMSTLEEKSRCNDRLLPFQSMLQDSGSLAGRMTLQFTRLADYARRRADWQTTEHERQAKDRRAAHLLGSVDISVLTAEPLGSVLEGDGPSKQERKGKSKQRAAKAELDEVDHIFQSVHSKRPKKHASSS